MDPDTLILDLALQSLADPAALPVLGDALQDTEWGDVEDARAVRNVILSANPYDRAGFRTFSDAFEREFLRVNSTMPTPTFARGVASYLLFRGWRTTPWRVIAQNIIQNALRRALRRPIDIATGADLDEIGETYALHRMWREERLLPDGTLVVTADAEPDDAFRNRIRLAARSYEIRMPEMPTLLDVVGANRYGLERRPGVYVQIAHPEPEDE